MRFGERIRIVNVEGDGSIWNDSLGYAICREKYGIRVYLDGYELTRIYPEENVEPAEESAPHSSTLEGFVGHLLSEGWKFSLSFPGCALEKSGSCIVIADKDGVQDADAGIADLSWNTAWFPVGMLSVKGSEIRITRHADVV